MTVEGATTRLGPGTTEAQFEAWVDDCRARGDADALAAILPETTQLFAGRGARQLARMRGYVLASFEKTGLPEAALPIVLEELENGSMPYTVAAAARAARGLPSGSADLAPFLLQALCNIQFHDDALTFDRYSVSSGDLGSTSGVREILKTIGWLGASARSIAPSLRALGDRPDAPYDRETRQLLEQALASVAQPAALPKSCCKRSAAVDPPGTRHTLQALAPTRVIDQEGRETTLGQYLGGHVAIVSFFYTRCDNPNKCSLTVARLAALQARVRGLAVRVAAMTYDPLYDLPPLLKTYGTHRGFAFSDQDRFLRVAESADLERVRGFFQLEVSYAEGVVSQHSIELSVLDAGGNIAARFSRLRWDDDEVVEQVKRVL